MKFDISDMLELNKTEPEVNYIWTPHRELIPVRVFCRSHTVLDKCLRWAE